MHRHIYHPNIRVESVGPDIQITTTKGKTEICFVITPSQAQDIFNARQKCLNWINQNTTNPL